MAVASLPIKPPDYGGYDNDFVDNVPDRLVCSTVCTKVLRDPHLTSCCGQHFCESCLQNWFDKHRNQSCPHCRAKGNEFTHILDKKLKREIYELKVRCSNKDKGCEWTGELQSLEKHLTSRDGCGYVQVKCPNYKPILFCSSWYQDSALCLVLLRKDLYKHLLNDCKFRLVSCKYCRQWYKFCEMHYHYRLCQKYPLDCPNKCEKRNIPRVDIPAHREKCPLEPVICPFAEVGCRTKPVRRELDKHLVENQEVHLLKLMADYKAMKEKEQQLESELKTTKRALTIQSGRLESMQLAISEDIDQLVGTPQMADYKHILETNLESVKRSINEQGFQHGVSITIPSKKYFEHSTEWYSPAFYIRTLKMCLLAQLSPQGSLIWSLVVLKPCSVDTYPCRAFLRVQMATSTSTSYDIEFKLPCMSELSKFSIIDTVVTEATTEPCSVTIYLWKDEHTLCTCA